MQKFMFNQMFDEEIIERQRQEEAERLEAERIAEENAPPTFTVEEMEAAKLVAHQQGMQEGKAEAMASIEQQANLTLEEALRQISDLLSQHKQWAAEIQHDSISLAMTIMRKLAPELLRGSELPQVEHIISEAFQFLTDQPKVMIRVASEHEDDLDGKVNLMASRVGYEGQVVLIGDPELELTDCRISWHAGAVERSLDETWVMIDDMVDRVLNGLPARDHPEPAAPEQDQPDHDAGGDNEAGFNEAEETGTAAQADNDETGIDKQDETAPETMASETDIDAEDPEDAFSPLETEPHSPPTELERAPLQQE